VRKAWHIIFGAAMTLMVNSEVDFNGTLIITASYYKYWLTINNSKVVIVDG